MKRKKQQPKLIPPCKDSNGVYQANDEGKVIIEKVMNYTNGQMYIGKIYTYHPTKGWRHRAYKEFKENKMFGQIKGSH